MHNRNGSCRFTKRLFVATISMIIAAISVANNCCLVVDATDTNVTITSATTYNPDNWFQQNGSNSVTNANTTTSKKPKSIELIRRDAICAMTLAAWHSYWPANSTSPLTDRFERSDSPSGALDRTIISALHSLLICGLRREFGVARKWIATQFRPANVRADIPDAMTKYVGGLLSMAALIRDPLFLRQAIEVARAIEEKYDPQTGLPKAKRELLTADLVATALEYGYLAAAFPHFGDRSIRMIEFVSRIPRNDSKNLGLFMQRIELGQESGDANQSAKWIATPAMPADGLVFESALIKKYIQSNYTLAFDLFDATISAENRSEAFTRSRTGRTYMRSVDYLVAQNGSEINSEISHGDEMKVESCNAGAMFALASSVAKNRSLNEKSKQYLDLAIELTETCHYAANHTVTGLPPACFYFTENEDAENRRQICARYAYDSGLAESYFTLYRTTQDVRYREYAWQLALAINRTYGDDEGRSREQFFGIGNVYVDHANTKEMVRFELEEPAHLFTVLRYLTLTFIKTKEIWLDQWVLNAHGFPLPICGRLNVYPADRCRPNEHTWLPRAALHVPKPVPYAVASAGSSSAGPSAGSGNTTALSTSLNATTDAIILTAATTTTTATPTLPTTIPSA